MTLEEYVTHLNALLVAHPEAAELDVVYSIDDEGNEYYPVGCPPSLGFFEGRGEGFIPECQFGEAEEWDYTKDDINAVCIN